MSAKHIHFIGICGVAMSALALAFKRAGWLVTGSDVGFYPPISTHLREAKVDFYAGWHPEKMITAGAPDLVVVGNVASSTNPEWQYVQEHKLTYKSYPEVIAEYFVKPNSIVCAGTYGKSSSTCLLSWILKETGYDPSYMFGVLSLNNLPAAQISKSEYSVLEGDEYKASRWDNGPKFAYYSPTHLLLTSVVWDHADVYPTEEKYFDAFKKLTANTKKLIVVSERVDKNVILNDVKDLPIITYGQSPNNDYSYSNVKQNIEGISFSITNKRQNTSHKLKSSCLGEYMADNITGCFAMAVEIGIAPEKIIAAVAKFKGMRRRLEKRLASKVTIFDDIAHSPVKAKSVLESLRQIYTGKIIAIFEPNTGNRRPQAKPWYNHAFKAADEVIIPRLTKIKIATGEEAPLEAEDLQAIISKTHDHVTAITDDEKLIKHISDSVKSGDVIIFLGSHGFRGMIDQLVTELSK